MVAVNRPGRRTPGTVGEPLPGLTVRIEDGEIVVDGPTVMDGYLRGAPAARPWRTGDLGQFDSSGHLTVYGRKDNLIVTSYGRNVSPEWIEAMLLADPRFAACAVIGHGEPHLSALLIPSAKGARWLAEAPRAHVLLALSIACREAPLYAVPRDFAARASMRRCGAICSRPTAASGAPASPRSVPTSNRRPQSRAVADSKKRR